MVSTLTTKNVVGRIWGHHRVPPPRSKNPGYAYGFDWILWCGTAMRPLYYIPDFRFGVSHSSCALRGKPMLAWTWWTGCSELLLWHDTTWLH